MPTDLDPPEGAAIHVWRAALGGGGRAAARAALEEILGGYLGGVAPALAVDPGGKPRLADDPGRLSFNLSHSGDLALVTVTAGGVSVGVDVERVKPRRDLARLAARWLPEDGAAAVAEAPVGAARERVFYAAWTRHEARAKCTGAGLAGPAPGPAVRAWPLELGAGYAAAVALDTAALGDALGTAALRDAAVPGPPPILLRDASCRG